MKIISVRENPQHKEMFIEYFQKTWGSENTMMVYDDCISHSLETESPLPQWYLLMDNNKIVGCAGLITNDFISRMDLYPWICAIFIEEEYRGNSYATLLMDKAKEDTKNGGFSKVYLCTEHIGFYEKYGFEYIGQGYHPWGESNRIYEIKVN